MNWLDGNMDTDAQKRLKAAIVHSGRTAKEISLSLGFAATYLSRLVTGNILEPSPSRLQAICSELQVDMTFILVGQAAPKGREQLISDLSEAPESVIADVAEFVRTRGLVKR